jgi:cytochrome c peroxidase
MSSSHAVAIAALAASIALPASAPGADPAEATEPAPIPRDYYDSFQPLPDVLASPANPVTPEKIALGRILFHDRRLSRGHDVACVDCHDLATGGDDGRRVSVGHRRQRGTRNAPTVFNAALHLAQFWDGRAEHVEDQAGQPILNPVEMAMPDEARVVATLRSMPAYQALFEQAFPDHRPSLSYETLGLAIGAFERVLVTPSRFDAFLAGDAEALSDEQRRGFLRFVELGCASCHNGPGVGGHSFEVLGLIEAYPDQSDTGIFEKSGLEADRMRFKTPGLRNATRTAPYFHDGSIATLAEAIDRMATYQLGIALEAQDSRDLAAFLDSLSGEPPAEHLEEPALPPSTDETPEPVW